MPTNTERQGYEEIITPFCYAGNETGCLLIHGFTATPQEMHGLGRYLAGQGLTVRGVLLAGHGTHPDDLARTTWQDWAASAEEGYEDLAARCSQVFVMGLSMGGALALHLAARRSVAGVVAMAAPLRINNRLAALAPLLRHFVRHIRKRGQSDWFDPEAATRRVAYDCYPVAGVAQMMRLQRQLRLDLPAVRCPVLLMHSRQDRRADPADMPAIYDLLGTPDKQMVWIDGSNHILTEDAAREQVWRLCYAFTQRAEHGIMNAE